MSPSNPAVKDQLQGKLFFFSRNEDIICTVPTAAHHKAKIIGKEIAVMPRLVTKMMPTNKSSIPTSNYQFERKENEALI